MRPWPRVLHLFANFKWTGPADPAIRTAAALRERGVDAVFAQAEWTLPDAEHRMRTELARQRMPVIGGLELRKHFHPPSVLRDAKALRALQRNVDDLGVQDRVTVNRGDALEPTGWLPETDLVLMDPPYPMLRDRVGRPRLIEAVRALYAGPLRAPGGIVLHTHPKDLDPEDLAPLEATERTYGRTALWYLWKEERG